MLHVYIPRVNIRTFDNKFRATRESYSDGSVTFQIFLPRDLWYKKEYISVARDFYIYDLRRNKDAGIIHKVFISWK